MVLAHPDELLSLAEVRGQVVGQPAAFRLLQHVPDEDAELAVVVLVSCVEPGGIAANLNNIERGHGTAPSKLRFLWI